MILSFLSQNFSKENLQKKKKKYGTRIWNIFLQENVYNLPSSEYLLLTQQSI